MKPAILTLTGPSCSGKSTLEKLLRKEHGFMNVVSTTTRPMREGEVDGESYYFATREAFQALIDSQALVECVEFNGNFYGVTKQEIERVASCGKPIVVVVEPEGLKQMRDYAARHDWDIYSAFVDCPAEVIAARFMERFTSDFALALSKGGEASRKVLDTYSKRLAVMMEQEVVWLDECYFDVEMTIDRFAADTQARVIEEIVSEFEAWISCDATEES